MLFYANILVPAEIGRSICLYYYISSAQSSKEIIGESLRPKRSKSANNTRTSQILQPHSHRILPSPIHTNEASTPRALRGLQDPRPVRTGARPRSRSSHARSGPHLCPVARCRPPHNTGVRCQVPAAPRSCRTRTCYCSPRAPVFLQRLWGARMNTP